MASIGHPLVGDPVYGRRRSGDPLLDAFPRQALHAWQLSVLHPFRHSEMSWEAPLPADFANLLATLRARP
jgi:23S rRNA pseudouridine1911/1915/1917 synthase